MAEPARLPKEDRPDIRPDLRALEGGGESSDPTRGHLSDASAGGDGNSGGLYNPDDNTASPSELKEAEDRDDDDLYNENGDNNRKEKARRLLKKYRKRAAIGGGILAGGVTGAVLISSIASGPGQLIDLSEILQRPSFGSNQTSKLSLNRIYRYWKTDDAGETRIGFLGSKVVGNSLDQLHNVGIDFQRDSNGYMKSATINTGKLQEVDPELKGVSDAEKIAILKQKFPSLSGLIESAFHKEGTSLGGSIFEVDTSDFGVDATRSLSKGSLAALEDGKGLTGIKFRVMAKYLDTPSLFHPIERVKAAVSKKVSVAATNAADQAEEERLKALEQPVAAAGAPAESSLKDKLTGKNLAATALIATAGMCLIRSVSDDVVAVNFGSIVLPSVLQATDKTAVGEQAKSGQDIEASQAGGVVDGFTDSNGQTIWQGKALQALEGSPQTGPDINHDYQQAFTGGTTAQGIKQFLGGGGFGEVACSTPGQIVQGIGGVALIVSGFFDAGVSWQAKAAQVGLEGASAAGTAGVISVLQGQFVKLLANKAVVPQVLSGPAGGNLFAYGAKFAANIGARSSGGIPLSAAAAAQLASQQQLEDQQSFQHESFFARMFDTNDYRSLTSRLATSLSPSITRNVATAATGFMNIGSVLPHALSSLLVPRAQAAANSYDWTFPEDGIPSSILNNPNLQDPYDNANKVAAILDAGDPNGYTGKAKTCFGVDISKASGSWEATPTDLVNPNSDDYANANCGDISDPGWQRVILFVSDTENMEAAACYQGDDDSCSNLGYDQTGAASSTGSATDAASASTPGTLPTGNAKDLAGQLVPYVKSGKISCLTTGCPDITNTANGTSIRAGSCMVDSLNPGLLGMLLELVKMGHTFILSALCSDHPTADGLTEHNGGRAADFNTIDGVFMGPSPTAPWDSQKITAAKKLDQDAASFMPKTTEFLQTNCHPTFNFLSDFRTGPDLCHHQHISAQS